MLIGLLRHFVLRNSTGSAVRQNESRYRESQNARVHFEPSSENMTPAYLLRTSEIDPPVRFEHSQPLL